MPPKSGDFGYESEASRPHGPGLWPEAVRILASQGGFAHSSSRHSFRARQRSCRRANHSAPPGL